MARRRYRHISTIARYVMWVWAHRAAIHTRQMLVIYWCHSLWMMNDRLPTLFPIKIMNRKFTHFFMLKIQRKEMRLRSFRCSRRYFSNRLFEKWILWLMKSQTVPPFQINRHQCHFTAYHTRSGCASSAINWIESNRNACWIRLTALNGLFILNFFFSNAIR